MELWVSALPYCSSDRRQVVALAPQASLWHQELETPELSPLPSAFSAGSLSFKAGPLARALRVAFIRERIAEAGTPQVGANPLFLEGRKVG